MKICIASPDIVGPIANGGVGTACTALAQTLAAAGHQVTLFFTSTYLERGSIEQWQEFYAKFDVELMVLRKSAAPPAHVSPTVYDEDNIARAYYVYEQLKQSDFDLIHFVDYVGLGYFTALAKSQGLCLQNTILAVTTHSPTLWSRLSNAKPVDDISYMVRDRLERRLIELCDLVISPSHYMLGWIRDQGWALPHRQIVLPNLLPSKLQGETFEPRPASTKEIKEVVLFGRLEPRKGLLIFCDAIDRINHRLPPDLKITFMGKLSSEYPLETLEARTAKWGRKVEFQTGFDTFQAVEYLKQDGRLAVLGALSDNSPYTTFECLFYQIPFISTDVGGVPELIAPADHKRILFPPTPKGLAQHLVATLAAPAGTFAPAQPSFDFEANKRAHLKLYEELAREAAAWRMRPPAAPAERPLVSVNILHYERPEGLRLAIGSIERQSYPNIELVIVDNGSREPETLQYLDSLQASGRTKLKIVRMGDNVYEPAGRNAGAEASAGKYVLFMDDDNVAKPHEVEVFCNAAERSGADVLTCFNDHFASEEPPARDDDALKRFIVVGDFGPLGMIINSYGDLNCFCRRDRFLEIGGFVVDGCFNHAEDWRFFAKAWARGLKLDVVPEALLWYRTSTERSWGQGWRKRDRGGALMRAAQAYLEVAPPEVAPFLYLSQGLFWKAVSSESARRAVANDATPLKRDNERLTETVAQLQFANEVLLRNYRALTEFIYGSVEPRLREIPEIQRALKHIRLVAKKYN